MIRIFVIFLAFLAWPVAAQPFPTAEDFQHRLVDDQLHGQIHWHLDNHSADKTGPLIVWLPGSGALPYFQNYADGSVGFSFPIELFAFRNDAHFLLIDKPGVPFSAAIEFDDERQRAVELDNPVYRAGISKDNLVARAALAIEAARNELGDRATELVIVGGSEGGQYAFALARKVQADRVVAWGGIALPQYYDLVLEYRLKAERGDITRAEAQAEIEQIYASIRAIEQSPFDTSERFYDEAYRRWASFGPYSAIDDMLALEVPLLLIQGGADSNAPILNSDYAMIAFLSQGRTNLEYWVYPDLDHFFLDVSAKHSDPRANRSKEVWARVWQWIGGTSGHTGDHKGGGPPDSAQAGWE